MGKLGKWYFPEKISQEKSDSYDPQVSINNNGIGGAVWIQNFRGDQSIVFRGFNQKKGWENTEFLFSTKNNLSEPQISINSDNYILISWTEEINRKKYIRGIRYNPHGSWIGPDYICGYSPTDSKIDADSQQSQLTCDDQGNFIVVWQQAAGEQYRIWANHFNQEKGWIDTPLMIENRSEKNFNPQIRLSNNGSAVCVWWQWDSLLMTIWGNFYVPGQGWSIPKIISKANAGNALGPKLDINDKGIANIVWQQYEGRSECIWTTRFIDGLGFEDSRPIDNDEHNSFKPMVSNNSDGFSIVTWYQSRGRNTFILTSTSKEDRDWNTPVTLSEKNQKESIWPQVQINEESEGNLIWVDKSEQNEKIYYKSYNRSKGWDECKEVASVDIDKIHPPILKIFEDGKLIVWEVEKDNLREIFSSNWISN